MNYSLATFGWPLHAFDDPCSLCCICPYLKISCCSCCCSRRSNKLRRNKSASKECPKSKNRNAYSVTDHTSHIKSEVAAALSNENDASSRNQQVNREKETLHIGTANTSESVQTLNHARNKTEKPTPTEETSNVADFVPIVLDDNCCGCNMASFEYRMSAHNYEVVYVNYKASVNVVPFLVVADHSKQSVVVAVRGSMSLSDMVIDMNGQIDPLPIDNCPSDWLCHRGIKTAAVYVKTKLLEEKILETAFACRPDLGSNEYSLIFCGHSLGAGVAAILGIIMRQQYPELKAYLYSPPGGILSLPAVEYTKEFSVGILLGNDCVPRLGMAQLERLRYYTLLSLRSSDRSAGAVLARAICPSFLLGGNKVDYNPSLSLNLLHGTEGRPFDYKGTKITFQTQPRMLYVPGKLIHVVKNHTFQTKTRRLFNGPVYQAIWAENTEYDRVMISEGMFRDHLPNSLMHAMKMLFSKTLPARKESSQSSMSEPRTVVNEVRTPSSSPQSNSCHPILEEITSKTETTEVITNKSDSNNNDTDTIKSDENNNSSCNGSTNAELQYPKLGTV